TDISKQLKSNKFFEAEHSVNLKGKDETTQNIQSADELDKAISEEQEKIFNDPDLKKKFDELNKLITKNESVKELRDLLADKPEIIIELNNIKEFKQKLIISYIKNKKEFYLDLK